MVLGDVMMMLATRPTIRRLPGAGKSVHCPLGYSARSVSYIHRIPAPDPSVEKSLDRAVAVVRQHDPSGYLPGRLLSPEMRAPYYAVRSFWVETGLRFGFGSHANGAGAAARTTSTPQEYLEWWQRGIDAAFGSVKDQSSNEAEAYLEQDTLKLLHYLIQHNPGWSASSPEESRTSTVRHQLDTILAARRHDLLVKQYDTLDDLVTHAQRSCAPLLQLVLESGQLMPHTHPAAHKAALFVGTCHGLTNALRTSIPVISTTGKLVVPADLCAKHGVKSPRYLLSALGQGDEECVRALQRAVQNIADVARDYLKKSRDLSSAIQKEPNADKAVRVLLPGLASETFLDRLQGKEYLLTDRSLRNVGLVEHARCAGRLFRAAWVSHTF